MPHYTGDISIFSIDSASQLAYFDGVTINLDNADGNTAAITAKGQRASILKTSGMIDVALRGVSAVTSDSTTHLDLTSLALGGLTFTCFSSTSINISYAKQTVPCAGSRWKMEDNTKLILEAEIKVQCVNGTASTLLAPFGSAAALADSNATYSLVFNSVTYTIPVLISSAVLTAERDGVQEVTVKLKGRSPDSGNFPSAPTGTTGLLQKAMNAYNTAVAFSFQSITSTNGVAVAGNVKFDSVNFSIEDEQIVSVQYNFRNYGAWTVAAGT